MRNFRELLVWQKAHAFTLEVYRISRSFPPEERFGLTSQIRRSASSIGTNIAEGCGRDGDRELARFISIAAGSASETEYHLLLAHDLAYLSADAHNQLDAGVSEVRRMLAAFHRKLTADR
jgi:four helix bundle protein